MQAPGRLLRGREPPLTRAAGLAAALLPVVASRLCDGVPYFVRPCGCTRSGGPQCRLKLRQGRVMCCGYQPAQNDQ